MTKQRALITGVTGQDGSYLAEFLLDRGYVVYGMERRRAIPYHKNLEYVLHNPDYRKVSGDMTDPISLKRVVEECRPDEIYNLAAQSFVHLSWSEPLSTNLVNYIGFLHLLEVCRQVDWPIKIYQASSSEMFGNQPPPQHERTPMTPRSPYGVSKLAAHRIGRVYRESFDMFVSCGICFNHESPRRGPEFVTRKIAQGVAAIAKRQADELRLGTLTAKRDWGYAKDYIRAMWLMLQYDQPGDYVIATGVSHSVEDFVILAFEVAGLDWKDYIVIDEELVRPAEVWLLRGDASKAKIDLNWEPTTTFSQLVEIMVKAELE